VERVGRRRPPIRRRLDALINNAGTTVPNAPGDWEGVTPESWDRVFSVNVRGLWQVTRAALPFLHAAVSPAIVNTCSIAGLRPGPQPFAYAASKAAVANLTKTFAGELGPHIRVNAVAPGWIEGEWMERTLGDNYEGLMARPVHPAPAGGHRRGRCRDHGQSCGKQSLRDGRDRHN
jgi:3-oxoacyl-[acyl-carrier protein] reductase